MNGKHFPTDPNDNRLLIPEYKVDAINGRVKPNVYQEPRIVSVPKSHKPAEPINFTRHAPHFQKPKYENMTLQTNGPTT